MTEQRDAAVERDRAQNALLIEEYERERLEVENARLRLALEGIASDVRVKGCEACAEKEQMARVALGGAA